MQSLYRERGFVKAVTDFGVKKVSAAKTVPAVVVLIYVNSTIFYQEA